jgi:tetratricopeptide (TPR) repeat protein/predicted aspartyl protease
MTGASHESVPRWKRFQAAENMSGGGLKSHTAHLSPFLAFAILSIFIAPAPASGTGCKISQLAEFPITMSDLRPLLSASINGVDVNLIVDSGAFYSMISPASAAELKLKTFPAPVGFYVQGVGGDAQVSLVSVKNFTLAGISLHDIDFLVGGTDSGEGNVGVLGQNVLHLGDVEYDLAQGAVRLMKAMDCGTAVLAYWASTTIPYSVVKLISEPGLPVQTTGTNIIRKAPDRSHAISTAFVNGIEIRVMFDSGASTSVLSVKAAARAGVRLDSPGVIVDGVSYGFGEGSSTSYIAPFASFKIGDEEIRNTKLRIGDVGLLNADMLVGADFFLSHRIYVANSQGRLYFTYNGGPVFNLTVANHPGAERPTDTSTLPADNSGATNGDAADYSRRGAAFASRLEFDQALAALTRACELAPENSAYYYQRGMVHWHMQQPGPAKADFDQSLKFKPNNLPALIARAELLIQGGDKTIAVSDLDAADAVAPREAEERYQMSDAYERADRLAPAVVQLTLWIDSHAVDARLPEALNSRCWFRALEGTDLELALKDCNSALRRAAKASAFYARVSDSRGLVFLRMAEYEKSIADYDASLKINSKNAWSLYGRGIDRQRMHKNAEADADIAGATAVWPGVAEEFERRGIVP